VDRVSPICRETSVAFLLTTCRFVESCLSPPDTAAAAAADEDDDKLASFIGGTLASEWRSRYVGKVNQIWVDLCRSDPLAITFSQAFLKAYVRSGTVTRLTLGPEEVIEEQAVNSADSLNTFWKTLIAQADDYILMPLRNADADNSNNLLLKRPKGWLGAQDEGPVAQITRVSFHATSFFCLDSYLICRVVDIRGRSP
jgi:hypothetical protein